MRFTVTYMASDLNEGDVPGRIKWDLEFQYDGLTSGKTDKRKMFS
ncbi:MAG: hypothetical protein NPIRA06_21190 [Nitrospirales bacterium]|nr:MAG: hypothetical protein NPIRA06_21190 [Nitrospirales bacterium]